MSLTNPWKRSRASMKSGNLQASNFAAVRAMIGQICFGLQRDIIVQSLRDIVLEVSSRLLSHLNEVEILGEGEMQDGRSDLRLRIDPPIVKTNVGTATIMTQMMRLTT